METKTVHIEMDCIHDHVNKMMSCRWLNGKICIDVYWEAGMLGVCKQGKIIETRELEGLSIAEFLRIQEQCQAAAESLAQFDEMAV